MLADESRDEGGEVGAAARGQEGEAGAAVRGREAAEREDEVPDDLLIGKHMIVFSGKVGI